VAEGKFNVIALSLANATHELNEITCKSKAFRREHLRGNERWVLPQVGVNLCYVFSELFHRLAKVIKGMMAGQQVKSSDAARVDVYFFAVTLLIDLFRCHKQRGSNVVF
jgi:hypothetical protein